MRDLVRPHRRVRANGGKDRLELFAVVFVDIAGEFAGAGVLAALVGRHSENVATRAEPGKAFDEQIVQLLRREIGIDAAFCAIEAHADNSTFFNPGASRTMITSAVRYALAAITNKVA